jgi:transposase
VSVETIPGIGILGATAIVATAADPTVFRSGRDFAAWIGLVPRQDSTGGKQKLRGRGRRRVFPRAADALDVGSISCVALIGRTSLREVLVISCLNRVAISYRDRDTIALDVRVVLLVIRAVHLRPDVLTPTAAE